MQGAPPVRHAFVVTSAVNSRFGVFAPAQRLAQTVATVASARARVPGCTVIVIESTGVPLQPDQEAVLRAAADTLIDFSRDPDVQAVYAGDNWDVVKNVTEITCFGRALQGFWSDGTLDGIDRIHKLSGRYLLTGDFDLALYESCADRILIGPHHASQFPLALTGIERQYMSRLWSWPAAFTPAVITVYKKSLGYIVERINGGGYADIEHALYKYLPRAFVTEVPVLGVEGNIAPNGAPVRD